MVQVSFTLTPVFIAARMRTMLLFLYGTRVIGLEKWKTLAVIRKLSTRSRVRSHSKLGMSVALAASTKAGLCTVYFIKPKPRSVDDWWAHVG